MRTGRALSALMLLMRQSCSLFWLRSEKQSVALHDWKHDGVISRKSPVEIRGFLLDPVAGPAALKNSSRGWKHGSTA